MRFWCSTAPGWGSSRFPAPLKALTFHIGPVPAVLLGMLTGIGGGMTRDVLVAEVPTVLRAELYAVAAVIGASVVVIADKMQLPTAPAAVFGALICLGLRFEAIRRGWRLPVARPVEPATSDNARPDQSGA